MPMPPLPPMPPYKSGYVVAANDDIADKRSNPLGHKWFLAFVFD